MDLGLGLYMRKNIYREPKIWVLLLLGLVFVLASCKKNLNEEPLGPARSLNDVAESFVEVVKLLKPNDIEQNDWVFFFQKGMILGQRIDAEIATDLSVYEAQSAECSGTNGISFKYIETQQKKIDGKLEDFRWDRSACMPNDLNTVLLGYLFSLVAPDDYTNTFHDITTDFNVEMAPQAVVDAGCPGMNSCEIRVYNVSFKQKLISPEQEQRVLFHQYKISPDVPFMARDISYCISESVEVQGSPIAVKQCVEVRNFGQKNLN